MQMRSKARNNSTRCSSWMSRHAAAWRRHSHRRCGPTGSSSGSSAGAPASTPKRWPSANSVWLWRISALLATSCSASDSSNSSGSISDRSCALAARHAREARHVVAAVERGEGCLQPDDEARRDVGAAAADLAQGLEAAVLVLVRLGLFGQLEQLLLELVERRGDALLQRHAGDRKHRLEHRARTRRQRRLLEVRQRLVLR